MLDIPENVKALFMRDNVTKNIRISFPNHEREDITNHNLIAESMQFEEKLCTREEFKFGLCESSSFSVTTFDVGNIKGMTIDASIEVDVTSLGDKSEHIYYLDDVSRFEISERVFPGKEFSLYFKNGYLGRVIIEFTTSQGMEAQMVEFESIEWYATFTAPLDNVTKTVLKFEGVSYKGDMRIESDYFLADVPGSMVSADVPFQFYRIPLGRFVVSENKRQSKSNKRDLIAYSYNLSLSELSKIELRKQFMSFHTSPADYVVNIEKFIYSNMGVSTVEFPRYQITSGGTTITNIYENDNYTLKVTKYIKSTWFGDGYNDKNGVYVFTGTRPADFVERRKGLIAWLERYGFNLGTYAEERLDYCYNNAPMPPLELEDLQVIYPADTLESSDTYIEWVGGVDYEITNKSTGVVTDSLDYVNFQNGIVERIQEASFSDAEFVFTLTPTENDAGYALVFPNDFKMAEFTQDYIELLAKFGVWKRNGAFSIEKGINRMNTAYVGTVYVGTFYLGGQNAEFDFNHYMESYYEDDYNKPFGRVVVKFLNENDVINEVTVQVEDFSDEKYRTYYMDNNYILRNTHHSYEEVENYANNILNAGKELSYMPAEIEAKGLPFIVAGDTLGLTMPDGSRINSIVLSRTLKGIQSLHDTYSST